jgi:hypothetical protein
MLTPVSAPYTATASIANTDTRNTQRSQAEVLSRVASFCFLSSLFWRISCLFRLVSTWRGGAGLATTCVYVSPCVCHVDRRLSHRATPAWWSSLLGARTGCYGDADACRLPRTLLSLGARSARRGTRVYTLSPPHLFSGAD